MPDPILLYGTRADGSQAPVAIDSAGRVRINGLGEKGDPGEPGPPGPPGEGGEAGGPGAAATVAVGNVSTGAAGSAASVSNTGTAYAAVLDFAIPRGDKGPPGEPGPPGDPGPKGDTGNVGPQGPARDNSGLQVFPTNGAASASPVSLTGTWFAGGTGTTTKPQFLVEPNGTTSTFWSTFGTGLGINAPSGFNGNICDFQLAGSSRFRVSSDGACLAGAGSASAVSYGVGNPNTGIYTRFSPSLGILDLASNGVLRCEIQASQFLVGGPIVINSNPNAVTGTNFASLYCDSSDILGLRQGTVAQSLRIYNTFTNADNFERLNVRWNSNEAIIDAQAGIGGGTLRGIKLGSAATSLLGFYGATPVVRPAAVADATDAATAISQLNAVLARLRSLGLIAT